MTLPAHAKTWVFEQSREANFLNWFTLGQDEEAARELILSVKAALCGHVRHGYSGSFSKSGSTITFTATTQGGYPRTAFTSDLIGKTIQIVGATTGGNNGYYTITGVTSTTVLTYENASGATEAFSGSYRVLIGTWSSLPNGRSPWKCKGSGAGTTGKGSGMDGIDRWVRSADLQTSTSGVGNRSWFVAQNEVSGAELCFFQYTNSTSSEFERIELVCSPNNGFTGGSATARPTATDESILLANSIDWCGKTDVVSPPWRIHVAQTTDGYDLHLWLHTLVDETLFIFSRIPTGVQGDSVKPWNGTRNVMGARNNMDVASWSDTAAAYACIDKDASAGGPFKPAFKLQTDLCNNSPLPTQLKALRNEVSGEYQVYPIGLFTATTSVRGRHGRMPDMFFVGDGGSAGMPMGARMASNAWVRVGDFLLPWGGSYRRF